MLLLLSYLSAVIRFAMDNKVEISNKNIICRQKMYTLTTEEKVLIRKLINEDFARLNAENITIFRKNKDQDYSIAELFRKNRKTAEEIYDKYIYYLETRHFAFAEYKIRF